MNFFKFSTASKLSSSQKEFHCYACGGKEYYVEQVIWSGLIEEWQLSPAEADIINLQQGMKCKSCNTHMRGNALAYAILNCLGSKAKSLSELIRNSREDISRLRILEINEAGNLGSFLSQFGGHHRVDYPDVDMHELTNLDQKYDLIVHSDTLEHVVNPVHALYQCKSVLSENGHLIYTVPVLSSRLTRDRTGLSTSSHSKVSRADYIVSTEFGADFWCYPLEAGFQNIQLFSLHYPIALAIAAQSST